MELYQIRHFVAVVETGSFTKGAEKAAVSQPALSASIARLEAELGVKLLERNRTRVTLTESGTKLLAVATEILRECNLLKHELKRISSPSVLRVGVLQTMSSQKISDALRAYRKINKDIAIELMDGARDELTKALASGRLDVAFSPSDGKSSKFAYRPLFTEKYFLAVPRRHPLANRTSIKLEELHDQPFIVRTSCETYSETTKLLVTRGIKTRPVYKTDQDDRALALVEAGLGVALMPAPVENEFIRRLTIADFDAKREIGLRWSVKREAEAVTEFIAFASGYDWSSSEAI